MLVDPSETLNNHHRAPLSKVKSCPLLLTVEEYASRVEIQNSPPRSQPSPERIINGIMKHAYWGVKCPNSDRIHLREYLAGYEEGYLVEPPDPYPSFEVACGCGAIHAYERKELQVVEGQDPARKAS
jgi:hypothetical protein